MGYQKSAMTLAYELEKSLFGDCRKSVFDAPWFSIPEKYEIQMTFPFAGAAVRFRMRKKGDSGEGISVYLDVKQELGCWNGEYWEAYPIDGDVARFDMKDTDGLIVSIINELEKDDHPNHSNNDLTTKGE